jgi:hypothetical protein
MDDHMSTGWESFFFWGRKFLEMPGFGAAGREHTSRAAEQLNDAREALLGSGEWLPTLRSGFGDADNSTVIHFAWRPFMDWAEANPATSTDAVTSLWSKEGAPAPERLDGFGRILPDTVLPGRGVRLNLAAYLLNVVDPVEWPTYRVTVIERACDLAQEPKAPRELSLGATYQHALDFFDKISRHAPTFDCELRDRLDAQQLAFSVTLLKDRPASISVDDWGGILAFRTVPSALRKESRESKVRQVKPKYAPNYAVCPLCGNDEGVSRVGPIDEERWEFVCEGGSHHAEPYSFPVSSR